MISKKKGFKQVLVFLSVTRIGAIKFLTHSVQHHLDRENSQNILNQLMHVLQSWNSYILLFPILKFELAKLLKDPKKSLLTNDTYYPHSSSKSLCTYESNNSYQNCVEFK